MTVSGSQWTEFIGEGADEGPEDHAGAEAGHEEHGNVILAKAVAGVQG